MLILFSFISGLFCSLIILSINKIISNNFSGSLYFKNKNRVTLFFDTSKDNKLKAKISQKKVIEFFNNLINTPILKKQTRTKILNYEYLIFFLPFFVCFIYFSIGTPNLKYYQNLNLHKSLILSDTSNKIIDFNLEDLIFTSDETSLISWQKLANFSKKIGNFKVEIYALENALLLNQNSSELKLMLAEALSNQAFGNITPKSRNLIAEVLKKDPNNKNAMYLAGLTAQQNGRMDLAKNIWLKLYESFSPKSKEAQLIKKKLDLISN